MSVMKWTKSPLRKATPPPDDEPRSPGLYTVILQKDEHQGIVSNLTWGAAISLIEDGFEQDQATFASIELQTELQPVGE